MELNIRRRSGMVPLVAALATAVLFSVLPLLAAPPAKAQAKPSARPAAPPAVNGSAAASANSSPNTGAVTVPPEQLIQYLNQSIDLYHQTAIQQQIANQPQEQLLLYDNRQLATQSVQLAFQFARAQLDIMTAEATAGAPAAKAKASSGSQQYNSLSRMLATIDKNLQDTQSEQADDARKLSTATGAERAKLQSTISELQGEIALLQARRDAVRSLLDFVSNSASSGLSVNELRAEVDALASSVPTAVAGTGDSGQSHSGEPFSISDGKGAPSNLWDLFADLFGLSAKLRSVNAMIADTDALEATSNGLRAPYLARLRELSQRGDALAAQADTADRSQLGQERQQLDAIAAQFRQLTSALIPLSKQRVLLDMYRKNLDSWREAVYAQYKSDGRGLAYRLGALAALFAVVWGLSELWRRGVFRYVKEPRRRHQFLLVRKLTFWFVIVVIVILTFASKLGSFVTFAGLLTAGLAVALQNVLVSVVGYFFLIGKFGIRVGDRIEISGVSGEVIDIGLVRFHVMELGAGATPTGRVVAFSNSVVFQPTAGLFKQIPGAAFAWHQVTLNLPRDADFGAIKKNLLGAVEAVLRDYHDQIESVYHQMEKTGIMMPERGLRPKLELHLTSAGIDATIRYPVDLQQASDIDARVSRELLNALERDTKLQTPEGPAIHLKTDVPAAAPTG